MSVRFIRVEGCDDSTKIRVDLTDEEADLVTRLFAAITSAGGGCMPVASITSGDPLILNWLTQEMVAEDLDEYPEVVIDRG